MLLIYEGHLAARHESRWMMAIFGVGLGAAMVYFAYKVCLSCWVHDNSLSSDDVPPKLFRIWSQRHTDTYKAVYKTLTVFGESASCPVSRHLSDSFHHSFLVCCFIDSDCCMGCHRVPIFRLWAETSLWVNASPMSLLCPPSQICSQ